MTRSTKGSLTIISPGRVIFALAVPTPTKRTYDTNSRIASPQNNAGSPSFIHNDIFNGKLEP